MESKGIGWINLAQETDVWWAVVNIGEKSVWFRNVRGKTLLSLETVSLSRRTLVEGVA